jgi:hypothetical protein
MSTIKIFSTKEHTNSYMMTKSNMGKVIPMDVIDEVHQDITHIVFLVDDERFRNKLVITPGLICFTDFKDSVEQMSTFKSAPECLENSTSPWRLMDIDELEDFYDFYKQDGMGEFYDLVEEYSFDYGSSDLVDIDNPDTSRIYCVDFGSGKKKSSYQYQEKALMMIRDVSDDDIVSMLKDILDKTSFLDFTFIAEKVIKVYPHLEERIKSLSGEEPEYSFKGSRFLRSFDNY